MSSVHVCLDIIEAVVGNLPDLPKVPCVVGDEVGALGKRRGGERHRGVSAVDDAVNRQRHICRCHTER